MNSLNQYSFQKELGKGNFGVVFQAIHIKTETLVAIKVSTIKKQQSFKLLQKQVDILTKINHPSIIKLKEYIIRHNTWYLVLQYCPGGNLQQYLEAHKKLNEPEVQTIACFLGDALRHLEQNKTAHRDIKLANILINQNGQVKLGDLGFARQVDEGEMMRSTAGTKSTMAPEIRRDGNASYNTKCDVWSFGVVLYQLLVRKNPFNFNESDYMNKPITFPSFVPKDAKSLIQRCLQIDPQKRVSAKQLMQHPWIKTFYQKGTPSLLGHYQYNSKDIKERIQMHNKQFEECLINQYNWAIFRSFEKFKSQFSKSINQFISNFENCLQKFIENQSLKDLLCKITFPHLNQCLNITVRLELPTGSFSVNKLFEDTLKIAKQQIQRVRKHVIQELKINEPQKESPYKVFQKELIYKILQFTDNCKNQDKKQVWKTVGATCQIIETNFKAFTIRLNFHPNLKPEAIKILKQKKQINWDYLQQIKRKGRIQSIPIQKMDVLDCIVGSSPKKTQNQFFQCQILKILQQTAELFQQ